LNFGTAWLTAATPGPRDVDARADVFGLGATLFFALTGEHLTPGRRSAARAVRPDLPADLDAALGRMLAPDPAARTASAAEVLRDLAPFLGYVPVGVSVRTPMPAGALPAPSSHSGERPTKAYRVLVVDDEEPIRRVCRLALQHEPVLCDEAGTGPDAVTRGLAQPYDLVLLDVDLPGLNGEQVLRKFRQTPPAPHLKVIMLSGRTSGDDLSRLLTAGADDYLTKPFSVVQLRGRVKAALRLKDAQDRSDHLATRLAAANAEMERALTARDSELVHARGAMVLALAKLVEARSSETGAHLLRLQRYCRVLAEAAAATPAFADRLEPAFVQAVEAAAPLHDIGKVAIPDHVLNKPGRLTPEEREVMQSHTTAGADTLAEVSARYPFASGFFHTAVEIARHHHERWDGTGYPDRLAGEAIPLSARLVAVADVYDALRSRRVYKPGYPHETAVGQMLDKSPGHFDPALLDVFRQIAPQFDRVYREAGD
jgi:response regulator RpfG family c-di-GMP phosphodiesterase